MRIILEGADGVGKTTLAKILADKYNLDICHCTQYDPADYNFYRESVRKNDVIWDRHTLGELIYPTIFERKQQIATEDARLVIHHALELDTKVFVLTTDLETIRYRLIHRGTEDPRILYNIESINQQFINIAKAFCIPIIDTSTMTLGDIYNLVF